MLVQGRRPLQANSPDVQEPFNSSRSGKWSPCPTSPFSSSTPVRPPATGTGAAADAVDNVDDAVVTDTAAAAVVSTGPSPSGFSTPMKRDRATAEGYDEGVGPSVLSASRCITPVNQDRHVGSTGLLTSTTGTPAKRPRRTVGVGHVGPCAVISTGVRGTPVKRTRPNDEDDDAAADDEDAHYHHPGYRVTKAIRGRG